MHQIKSEVTNQHSKEVSSRAEFNEPNIDMAKAIAARWVDDAKKKRQKIKMWIDGQLHYSSDKFSAAFLDYEILNTFNGDGWILRRHPFSGEQFLYETHLGNYSTQDDAQKAAVIYFMIARQNDFAKNIFLKVMGRSGCYLEFLKFQEVVKKAGLVMPEEITPIGGMNQIIGYKGAEIKSARL